jgi:methionine-rich copper-binding protein CopC
MALNKIDDAALRQYLLGKLSDEDLEAFEKRLLTDDEAFEEMLAAEDDLVDEYVANRLNNSERETFEKHFLITTERQEDVDFARTLRKFIQKEIPTPHWWDFSRNHAWVSRIAGVIVVSFVAFLAYYYIPRAPRSIAEITLTPSIVTRGQNDEVQATEVNLRDKDALKINLKLPADSTPATNYRAELIGYTKATVNTIKHDNESVTVEIAAGDLPPAQYALRLHAISSDGSEQRIRGSYSFIVQKN